MKNKFIIYIYIICSPLCIVAQHATGLSENDTAYAQMPIVPQYEGSKADDLPRKVDLRPYCPTPRSQGTVSSCVGWSFGYAALTIEKAIKQGWTDTKVINDSAFSALFIYNQIKENETCNASSTMPDAINFLQTNGNCLAQDFDFKTEDCSKKPDKRILEKAKQYTIREAPRLFEKEAENLRKIQQIRTFIAKKKPVIISLKLDETFFKIGNKKMWTPIQGNDVVHHAITIVGYDDETQTFTLLNSWGTEWGDNGFIKVKYRVLVERCPYAYVIYLKNDRPAPIVIGEKPAISTSFMPTASSQQGGAVSEAKPKQKEIVTSKTPEIKSMPDTSEQKPIETRRSLFEMAGNFDIQVVRGSRRDPVAIERIRNHYTLKRKDWKVGEIFQLTLTSDFSEIYVYVMSVNPKNEANVIFPRNEEYGEDYKGLHETPLIMLEGARITLPEPDSGLKLKYPGTDRLCIFFSLSKITNLPKVCEALKNHKGDFEKHVFSLLDDKIIPLADINFKDDKIDFSTATRSEGVIVPIIVEFQAK